MSFGVIEFIFVRNVRSHFQMEINILQIAWTFGCLAAGVEFPMFRASLSRSLGPSRARPAAGCSRFFGSS